MDMYFNINNETQSKQLQEVLFAQGYRWRYSTSGCQEISFTDKKVIIARNTGYKEPDAGKAITWCAGEGSPDGRVVGSYCYDAIVMDTEIYIAESKLQESIDMEEYNEMKFRLESPEQSATLQEVLFEFGYQWEGGSEVMYVNKPFLYTNEWGYISHGTDPSYFGNSPRLQYRTDDFIREYEETGTLPSPAKEAPPMPECKPTKVEPVISNGGSSSYYKLTITNKAGESIECVTGDVLRALVGNDYDLSNIVKACRRSYEASQGRGKAGATIQYDMNKVKYFADEYAHWHQE